MLHGADISKWQGDVNWDAIKSSLDFCIFRASTGCPDAGQTASQYRDAKFVRNRDESRRVGILRGYYHFARPDVNGNRAEDEANCFCDNVMPLREGEILALDYETDGNVNQVDWCKRFLDTCYARTGVRPVLYIDRSRHNSADWSPVVNANYGLWLAHWDYNADAPMENTQWPLIAIRQYSNKGNVAGITPLDLDVFYGNADQYKAYGLKPTPPAVDPRDQQIADLTTELNIVKATRDNLKAALDEANASISDLKNSLMALEGVHGQTVTELETCNITRESLLKEKATAFGDIDAIHEKYFLIPRDILSRILNIFKRS